MDKDLFSYTGKQILHGAALVQNDIGVSSPSDYLLM
jgi:hypothetical protein